MASERRTRDAEGVEFEVPRVGTIWVQQPPGLPDLLLRRCAHGSGQVFYRKGQPPRPPLALVVAPVND